MGGIDPPIEMKVTWRLASLTFDVSKLHTVCSQGYISTMLIKKRSRNDIAPSGARLFADCP